MVANFLVLWLLTLPPCSSGMWDVALTDFQVWVVYSTGLDPAPGHSIPTWPGDKEAKDD